MANWSLLAPVRQSTALMTQHCSVRYGPSIVIMQGWGRRGTLSLSIYVYTSGWSGQPNPKPYQNFSRSLPAHHPTVSHIVWSLFTFRPLSKGFQSCFQFSKSWAPCGNLAVVPNCYLVQTPNTVFQSQDSATRIKPSVKITTVQSGFDI